MTETSSEKDNNKNNLLLAMLWLQRHREIMSLSQQNTDSTTASKVGFLCYEYLSIFYWQFRHCIFLENFEYRVVYSKTATSYSFGAKQNWYQSYNSTITEIGAQRPQSGSIAWPSPRTMWILGLQKNPALREICVCGGLWSPTNRKILPCANISHNRGSKGPR